MGAFSSALCCCPHCQKDPDPMYEEGRRIIIGHTKYPRIPKEIYVLIKYFETPDGAVVYTKSYIPKHMKPKALIFYVPGYSGFTDRAYCIEQAIKLCMKGYFVFSHDHIGHGKTDGLWMYIKSFSVLYKTAHYIHEKAKELYIKTLHFNEYDTHPSYHIPYNDLTYINENNNYILYGSSMGGAIAITLAYNYPKSYKSMILLSPMTGITDTMRPNYIITQILLYLQKKIPKLRLVPPGKTIFHEAITSTPEKIDLHCEKTSLLWGNWSRVITAVSMLKGVDAIFKNINKVYIPFFIAHGIGDRITSAQMSKKFHDETSNVKDNDKELHMINDNYHTLVWQPCADYLWGSIFNYLDKILANNNDNNNNTNNEDTSEFLKVNI